MRTRKNPKPWFKHIIEHKRQDIGYIQLVDYCIGKSTPHLEYQIYEAYRSKGFMSIELPKYLMKLNIRDKTCHNVTNAVTIPKSILIFILINALLYGGNINFNKAGITIFFPLS